MKRTIKLAFGAFLSCALILSPSIPARAFESGYNYLPDIASDLSSNLWELPSVLSPSPESSGIENSSPIKAVPNSTMHRRNRLVEETNNVRRQNGKKPLSNANGYYHDSQRFAEQMASENRLYHDPSLRGWGENVGYTSTHYTTNVRDYYESGGHRENMLHDGHSEIATGVAWSEKGNRWYTVQRFR